MDISLRMLQSGHRFTFLAEEKEYKTDWLFARSEPFPVCTVNDFLASPPHSIQELEDQMVKHLTLNPKKNDLYQFSQSDEIMKMRNGIFHPDLGPEMTFRLKIAILKKRSRFD